MGKASVARERSASAAWNRRDEAMIDAPSGWYFDPDDEAIYRYWDGHAWTMHRSDLVTGPPIDLTVVRSDPIGSEEG